MEFKNNKEMTLFILMNLFGWPGSWIIFGVMFGWIGFGICLVLFFAVYLLWKKLYHSDATMGFGPKINRMI